MHEYDYSKLRGRIVEKFGTYAAFFKMLDITDVQASKKLNGKAGFSQDDMVEWSKLLDIEIGDIGIYFCAVKV